MKSAYLRIVFTITYLMLPSVSILEMDFIFMILLLDSPTCTLILEANQPV